MDKKPTGEIRIILAITVLAVIVCITGYITYHNLTEVIRDVENSKSKGSFLSTIKTLNNDLNEAENNIRAFNITRDSLYFNRYITAIGSVKVAMSAVSTSDSQAETIDSLQYFIAQKLDLFNRWLLLGSDEEVVNALSIIDTDNNPDKTPDARKKGLLESQVLRVRIKQQAQLRQIKNEELSINRENEVISGAIRRIITREEKKENEQKAVNTRRAIKKTRRTNYIIATFSFLSITLLVLITLVLIRYINKTRKYNTALKQAQQEAENLAIAKQNFAANISHEIRTPINSIIGFSNQLLKTSLTVPQQEQMSIIVKSSEHLLKIVNDVLDYSKLQVGKMTFEKAPFNPNECISEVIEVFKSESVKKNVPIVPQLDPEIPEYLVGDAFRLQQVLLNIMGNALKFTENGKIEVLSSYRDDGESGTLSVKVKDTGVGIPANKINEIFEDFTQADNSVSRRFGGTGLGLSISKKIIEWLGGSIHVESTVGKGTTFTILLPYPKADPEESMRTEQSASDLSFLQNKKILAVDDDPYNRLLIEAIIKPTGAIVSVMDNAKSAIERLKSEHFDLLMTDIRMPDMSGIDMAKIIRSDPDKHLKTIPIIALTASKDPEKKRRCLEAGMNAFLSKPFKEQEMFSLLEQYLGNGTVTVKLKASGTRVNNTLSERPDIQSLLKISNGDNRFVAEMLDLFVKTTTESIDRIEKALEEDNLVTIREESHKIIPSCRHLGLKILTEKLMLLEAMSAGEKPSGPDQVKNLAAETVKTARETITLVKETRNNL